MNRRRKWDAERIMRLAAQAVGLAIQVAKLIFDIMHGTR